MSGHSKWNNIKHKKEKADAAKAKIFTKIGKEMAVAIKAGGADPNNNSKLRDLIAKAKANNVPNDNIQRTIKKFSDNSDINFEEIVYEGYGPSGVAIIVETQTDNRNRTAGNVRAAFSKYGGNLGQNGCVGYLFEEKGVISIVDEDNEIDEDKIMEDALEAGAEDIMNKFPYPDYTTAVVHGKQLNDVKKFNMDAFAAGRANILVATSVIEVGVDVPNASVMVIESAERFGLSQLHQLRGRVGRGSEKSYCVLMTGHKLSKESKHRIELMCATENGFELAEEDMKMRGPGDLEGTQQSGLPISLNIASLAKDGLILNAARDAAEAVLKEDSTLSLLKNQLLRNELVKDKYKIKDYSKIS